MNRQRTVFVAAAVGVLASGVWHQASGAQATGRSGQRGAGSAQARPDTGWSSAHIDRAMRLRADSLRAVVLKYAGWVGFANAPCAVGDVRTFESDTLGVVRRALGRLEFLVLTYGAYVSLDNASGRALLRAVVRLETGGPPPRWDVLSGTAPRVLNAILPASLYNPETKKCVQTPGTTPHGIVLPEVANFTVPRDSGAADFAVSYGPKGLNTLRDHFASKFGRDSTAVFRNTRVIAHAVWQDYAIIAVQRDVERLGAIPIPEEGTGATYAFRRVGAEWRVLAMIRNW